MLALGLLLIILASALTIGAVYDGGDSATVEILGQSLTTTVAGVFFAGAVTMLMFLVGVWALMSSMGRARRKRTDRKTAKNDQKQSVLRLEEERAALKAENERLAEKLAETGPATTAHGGSSAPATGDGSQKDRAVDHDTDVKTDDPSGTSGRHRDPI